MIDQLYIETVDYRHLPPPGCLQFKTAPPQRPPTERLATPFPCAGHIKDSGFLLGALFQSKHSSPDSRFSVCELSIFSVSVISLFLHYPILVSRTKRTRGKVIFHIGRIELGKEALFEEADVFVVGQAVEKRLMII